jgi:hypothetical protein
LPPLAPLMVVAVPSAVVRALPHALRRQPWGTRRQSEGQAAKRGRRIEEFGARQITPSPSNTING